MEQLHREIARAVANARVSQLLTNLGAQPVSNTPDEFAAFIRAQAEKWGRVIRNVKIAVD